MPIFQSRRLRPRQKPGVLRSPPLTPSVESRTGDRGSRSWSGCFRVQGYARPVAGSGLGSKETAGTGAEKADLQPGPVAPSLGVLLCPKELDLTK